MELNGFNSLQDYLYYILNNCPNDYFNSGPRSSALKFKLDVDIKPIKNHEMCGLCKNGLDVYKKRYSSNHSKVGVFMLENDDKTIALEIPVWMHHNEANDLAVLNSKDVLTGHIDILRLEHNKLWIWDYKPNAHLEEFAATQVYFYALMLSKRTNIDIKNIRCGYFDDNYAFVFKPCDVNIKENSLLNLKNFINSS